MCGFEITVLEGSVQVAELKQANRTCRESGLSGIEISATASLEASADLVSTGAADGLLADFPATQYAVQQNPTTMELAGDAYDRAPLGMMTSPAFPKLAKAIRRAVQSMINSGYYAQVLKAWDVSDGAVDKATLRRPRS